MLYSIIMCKSKYCPLSIQGYNLFFLDDGLPLELENQFLKIDLSPFLHWASDVNPFCGLDILLNTINIQNANHCETMLLFIN